VRDEAARDEILRDGAARDEAVRDGVRSRTPARLVVLLGALVALGPLTVDLYLPALPRMTVDLRTTESMLQLTLTASVVGSALGQLVAGPISDAVGRRLPMLAGLAGYVATSVLCALAPTIEVLIVARVAQAVSGAAGIVVARAVLRDLVSGRELARLLSVLVFVSGMAPIVAPVIGGQLLRVGGWRTLFVVLAAFGTVLLVVLLVALPESLPPDRRQRGGVPKALRAYVGLLVDPVFVGYALAGGFAFGALFGYISGSSFVFEGVFGLSPQQFSLLFAVNSLGLMLAAQTNGRLVRRLVEPRRMLTMGQLAAVASAGVLVAAAATSFAGLYGVVVPLFFVVATFGLVTPNAQALALARYPESAGTAAAVLGAAQFAIASFTGPMATAVAVTSALPMAVVVAGSMVLGLAARVLLTRAEGGRATEPAAHRSEG